MYQLYTKKMIGSTSKPGRTVTVVSKNREYMLCMLWGLVCVLDLFCALPRPPSSGVASTAEAQRCLHLNECKARQRGVGGFPLRLELACRHEHRIPTV